MDEFFPSEIARLVLGYLKEAGCMKSWKTFLEESINLQEYFLLYKKGKVYSTNVDGKSLLEILTDYRLSKKDIKSDNEAGQAKVECSNSHFGFSAEMKTMIEEIVRNVVDVALQKYFHGNRECSSSSSKDLATTVNYSKSRVDICDANIQKSSNCFVNNVNENKGGNRQINELNSELNATSENSCYTSQYPNVCHIFSVGDSAHVLDSSKKTKDETLNDSCKDKSADMPEVINVDDDDDDIDSNLQIICSTTNIESKDNRGAVDTDAANQKKQYNESNNGCAIEESCGNGLNQNATSSLNMPSKSFSVTQFSISDNEDSTDKLIESLQSNINMVVDGVIKMEPDLSDQVHSDKSLKNTKVTSSKSSVSDRRADNNDSRSIEITNISSYSSQNTISDISCNLNSSNNQLGLATVNELPLSTTPTYILPNFSTSGFYMQAPTPYGFVMNAPFTGISNSFSQMPLTLPGVALKNISNPVFASNSLVSVSSNISTAVSSIQNKVVDEKHSKNKSEEDEASKKKIEPKLKKSASGKRDYTKRPPKRKPLCLFPPPSKKGKGVSSNKIFSDLSSTSPDNCQSTDLSLIRLPKVVVTNCRELQEDSALPNSSYIQQSSSDSESTNVQYNKMRDDESRLNIEVLDIDDNLKLTKRKHNARNKRKKIYKPKDVLQSSDLKRKSKQNKVQSNIKKNKLPESEIPMCNKNIEIQEENKQPTCYIDESPMHCDEIQNSNRKSNSRVNTSPPSATKVRRSMRFIGAKRNTKNFSSLFDYEDTIDFFEELEEVEKTKVDISAIINERQINHPKKSSQLNHSAASPNDMSKEEEVEEGIDREERDKWERLKTYSKLKSLKGMNEALDKSSLNCQVPKTDVFADCALGTSISTCHAHSAELSD